MTIPEGVTNIGDFAFSNCSGLTNVTIPKGVTSIGFAVFQGCSSLTSVVIPESVTSIGMSAFLNCSSLTSVTIPKSVTSIGDGAFNGCRSLTDVEIPEGVTSIEGETFMECNSLASVAIPESVTSIGEGAFFDCWELTDVTIPRSVTSIGECAFSRCSSLTSVAIPEGVTSIGVEAFSSCSGLTSIIVEEGNSSYDSRDNCNAIIETESSTLVCGCKNTVIPEGVASIGCGSFFGCSDLTGITIPGSVTSIGHDAFERCSGLTDMTIPKNVTYIGVYAFEGCRNLKRVTISENVTDIYDKTFYGCSSLTSVAIPESVTSIGDKAFGYYGDENGNDQKIPNFVIYGESGSAAEKYAKDNGFTFKIPGSLENISTASVTLDKTSYIYDGKAKTPSVTVKLDGKTLTLNTDYTVSYSDNINAGTAKVTVIGKGNYTGSKTVNFTITVGVADISNATVTLDKTSYIYDGKAKTPSVTVKLDGKTLTLNTDYTVSYSDNINAGTAKVTVTGKGNYTGSKTVNFTIAKAGQDSSITCKKTLYKVAYGTKPFKINAASKSKLTFTSSKPKIVSVDKDTGKVTIKNTGVAIITIKAGKDSVKVTVKVSPKKQDIKSVNVSKGKKLTVKWAKDKTASGYQVQVSIDKKFKKGVKSKNLSKTSYTFTKLKAGKKYYVRMRSYKKSGKETLYSTWSKTKTSNKVKK